MPSFSILSSACDNLLQEFCPGDGIGIEVLFHDNQPLTMFQHRRLKELPVSGGGSVTSISEPLDPELAEQAVALLRKLNWEGVAMVEFKYDRAERRVGTDGGERTLLGLFAPGDRRWYRLPVLRMAARPRPATSHTSDLLHWLTFSLARWGYPPAGESFQRSFRRGVPPAIEALASRFVS